MLSLSVKLSGLLLLALSLAACTNAPQTLPALFPPVEPTRAPTRAAFVPVTATAAPAPTLARPATIAPAVPPGPLVEPTRAPTRAAFEPAPATASSVPTITPKPSYMIESSTVLSPNGQWIALTEVLLPASAPSDQYHRQLRVLRADRLQEWVAIDEWSNYGLGYPVPVVVHWSPDGAAMFFADQAVPDGCGAAYLWNYRRLDLASGEVAATLEGGGHAYAFAPTTSALAVGSTEAGQPVLRVTNGTITAPHALTLVLPMDYRIEQIAWSEDEGSLILASVAGDSACGGDALPPRTYLRVDLVDAAQTVLLADDRRGLQLQGWSGADRLVLSDAAGQQWVMDANTGVLTQRP